MNLVNPKRCEIFIGGNDGSVSLWDLAKMQLLVKAVGRHSPVR
jgi:hypothetical protein